MKADDIKPRFVLDGQAAGELKYRLKQDPQAGLKEAARQFEGMLLNMVLKSMRDATPMDGLMDSDQTRFYTSILDQQLAQNLSSQNGLGFAAQIEQQLGRATSGGADAGSPLEALLVGIHDEDEEHTHTCGCGCEDDDEDVIIAKIVTNDDGEDEYVEPTDEEFEAVQQAYNALVDEAEKD